MKEKINACYERLQQLSIAPTKGNMEILLQTLYDLKSVYEELSKEAESHDGPAADPGGSNND